MTYKDLHRILLANGFVASQGHGSHINYRKPGHRKMLTISGRKGKKTIPPNALADYIRKSSLPLKQISAR